MSTETHEKQAKGAKGNAEKKSKKRRREEQAQDASAKAAVEAESTPAKKQKKSKKEREDVVQHKAAQDATSTALDGASGKKEKKKRRKSNDAPADEAAVEDVKTAASASPDVATADTSKPARDGESPEATKKSKKKKKKDRRASEQEINGTANEPGPRPSDSEPTAGVATHSAIDEKQLQKNSPFTQVTASFYLALSPIAHQFPLEGLCAEHISPMLLTYHPPLKGVVISYSNPRMSEEPEKGAKAYSSKEAKVVLGRSIDEYAVTYVWLTAEFLIFKPQRDTVLEGYVNLQNESILGLICYNYFNAGIERSRIPKEWQWVEDESAEGDAGMSRRGRRNAAGHYVDASGQKIEGRLVFKVKDFEATAGAENGSGSINIYGTLLAEREDAKVDEEERQKTLVRNRPRRT